MNFDLTLQLPTTFDVAHIALASLAFIFLLAAILKPSKKSNQTAEAPIDEKDSESELEVKSEAVAEQPSIVSQPSPDSALQLLSLLQKEARLIDFVHENISEYSDEDVGVAARVVHEGSLKAINEYFKLTPIRSEEEESRVTLAEGFNAAEVRLTGNVVGSAPFTGTLVHRGWRAEEVTLPKLSEGHDVTIVAAAEVEL